MGKENYNKSRFQLKIKHIIIKINNCVLLKGGLTLSEMINDNEVYEYKRKCVLSILEPNLTSLASNCTVLANYSGSDSIIALR